MKYNAESAKKDVQNYYQNRVNVVLEGLEEKIREEAESGRTSYQWVTRGFETRVIVKVLRELQDAGFKTCPEYESHLISW